MNLHELKELHVREVRDLEFLKSSQMHFPYYPEKPDPVWKQPSLVTSLSWTWEKGGQKPQCPRWGRRSIRKSKQKCPSAKLCQCKQSTQSRTLLGEKRNLTQHYLYLLLLHEIGLPYHQTESMLAIESDHSAVLGRTHWSDNWNVLGGKQKLYPLN